MTGDIEHFVGADEMKEKEDQIKSSVAERPSKRLIQSIKNRLGSFTVMCPGCGKRQETQTTRSKSCVVCGMKFQIYPKSQPSRIIYCDPAKRGLLFQLYYLEKEGKMMSIL